MGKARGVIAETASEFTSHFGRDKVGAVDVAGDPGADTALITVGTIGDTARELLGDGDAPLLVRVHAYRPFPVGTLSSLLSGVRHVCVVDRASAFGSFGPLGGDVRALDLAHAQTVTNFICGIGGTEVTPDTLRWALQATRTGSRVDEPVHVPEGV